MQDEQRTQANETLKTIQRFDEAFNAHDVDAIMALMTPDCVFENTYPPPDGARHVGHVAVRAAFDRFFQSSPQASFVTEEMFVTGQRGVVRWIYRWSDTHDEHIRGVDIFRIQNGQVAEKLSYVKG